MTALRVISQSELSQHTQASSCWIAVGGIVYDVTSFLEKHPGGSRIILSSSGRDCTADFEQFHPVDIISKLGLDTLQIGTAASDVISIPAKNNTTISVTSHTQSSSQSSSVTDWTKPSIGECINVFDFERIASKTMSKGGWCYNSTGADDEMSLRENHQVFNRIWLRPRVMVDVSRVDISTKLMGYPFSSPIYVSATALCKLAHPEGEIAVQKACVNKATMYMIPLLSSTKMEDVLRAATNGFPTFVQLYINPNRKVTEAAIKRAIDGGVKAFFVTVDAPQLGRREKDLRMKKVAMLAAEMSLSQSTSQSKSTSEQLSSYIDPSFTWDDLRWLASITTLPIVLKGIQTGEDAILAYQHGVRTIILSNHGGRQCDYARSAVEVMIEVVAALKQAGIGINSNNNNSVSGLDIYIDGGVRRGTDVFKCLALGAKGVGIGRPAVYGLASFGQQGVERVIEMLQEELIVTMRQTGCQSLSQITPSHVIMTSLANHASPPVDHCSTAVYEPLMSRL